MKADEKLEKRICRLYNLVSRSKKFEEESTVEIPYMELMGVIVKLAGISHANRLLNNYKEILERLLDRNRLDSFSLNYPITAPNFAGDLAGLLNEIFDHVDGVQRTAEEANRYNDMLRKKYNIRG